MKRLSTWDTYVREALKDGDRSIELPLTDDESYVIGYPTRRQGREIARCQRDGDTDGLLVAMLGDEAGVRVRELSEDWPAFVLDEFLIDVMKKFGMLPDDAQASDENVDGVSTEDEPAPAPKRVTNGTSSRARTNGAAGKAPARRKSGTPKS